VKISGGNMVNLRKNWWKILILTIIVTVIDIAGHIIEGTPLPDEPLSIISKTIGLEAAISIYFIIFFLSISITFLIIEKWLSGSKIKKGLRYGIAWALIMYAGVCETNTILGTSVIADIRMAFVDAIPLIILGILLGKLFASKRQGNHIHTKKHFLTLITITLFFLIGRYFSYTILQIDSGFIERPLATFIWTFCMGLTFGILHLLAGKYVKGNNQIKRAIMFGAGIVGVNWFIYNLFAPLIFQESIINTLHNMIVGRVIVDIVFITLGMYIGECILNKGTKRT
jgi:hypothetical protein